MFQSTRLIYIPSIQKFLQFKDFKNEHLFAMARSQDSSADAVCTQWDIIKDCLVDTTVDVNELTLIDSLFIFLTWRINCLGNILELGNETQDYLEVNEWLISLHPILSKNFNSTIECDNNISLGLGIPTMHDDADSKKFFMLGGSGADNKAKENINRRSVCMLQTINGERFEGFHQKKELFDLLSMNDCKKIINYSNKISNILSSIALTLKFEEEVEFGIDLIPSLISFLFSSNIENLLRESLYMTKKCNISFTDFQSMLPLDSQTIMDYMEQSESEQEKET